MSIGIEGGLPYLLISRPEAETDHFMGVCLALDDARPFPHRCRPAGKPGQCQIKVMPEEMDRGALSGKSAPEDLEEGIDVHENLPESVRIIRVIG